MRDYNKQPLKNGENIPKDELYELYIVQNWTRSKCCEHFKVGHTKFKTQVKMYNFIKTPDMIKASIEKLFLERYNETHPRKNKQKNEEISEKTRQTCLDKYGFEYVSQVPEFTEKQTKSFKETYKQNSKEIEEKKRKTCQERYGADNYAKTEESKQRHAETNMRLYGATTYLHSKDGTQQVKQTNLNKYGFEYATQSKEVKEKQKQTCLERYGAASYMKTTEFREKGKQTLLYKYGVENYNQADDFKEKCMATNRKKYGYDFASQSPEFREQVNQTNLKKFGYTCNLASPDSIAKKKATWLKNMGVDHPNKCPAVVQKQWETKKRKGTASTSKDETAIKKMLKNRFSNVEFNYDKDKRYPFHCDFYLPDMDLFIEFQYFEGHGGEPFNPENTMHMQKVALWWERAFKKPINKKNKYYGYIITWTYRDVLKRLVAKENNLNYMEFFTKKEFDVWFNSL